MSVGVVIITYNRLEFLKEILEAVKNQSRKPDEIIVINNSNTDGTGLWLEQQSGITVITQDNVGSSGGQHTGIKAAYMKGYDFIWTMDDDVVPENKCLEVLLENATENTITAPLRRNPDGSVFINDTLEFNLTNPFKSIWKKIIGHSDLSNELIPAIGITFEGPLFHRSFIDKCGLPEFKFFIYGDDSEFFIRCKKAGAEILLVKNAVLNRKYPPPPKGNNYSWKSYYELRNLIAIDVLHGSLPVRLIRPLGYLAARLIDYKKSRQKLTALKAFFNGYFYKSKNKGLDLKP